MIQLVRFESTTVFPKQVKVGIFTFFFFFFYSGKCDYFNGDWVPNPLGPIYTNETCDLIESHQNCMKNGRPDREFLYWKWAPTDCELPIFDPQRFLNLMRGKVWALIGDSISRNHVQSLLCTLSKVWFFHC